MSIFRQGCFDWCDWLFITEISARRIRFLEYKKQTIPDELKEGIEIEVHDDIPF